VTDIRIPLCDLRIEHEDIAAVRRTLETGWLTMGPATAEVEGRLAERLGVRHAIATASGTAALQLAFLAAGVGAADEVIVPAITFVATAAAVRHCGATAVCADVLGEHDLGIDPGDVEARLTDRTVAVCAMHYAGYPARVEELRALCDARGIRLIEDSAHHPDLPPVGDAACLSFFTNKVLACGEGGLVATDDDELARDVRIRRAHGLVHDTWARHQRPEATYDVAELGFNFRIDDMRASLLASRLTRLDEDLAARRALVRHYRARLATVQGVRMPYEDADVDRSACYAMPILVDEPERRDAIRARLRADHGIQTSVLYPPLHELTARPAIARGPLERAETLAQRQVTLPLYAHMTMAQVDEVVDALDAVVASD
jgi:dTDP-4-amino-4,6-dideoxygalactose transaminase